MNRASFIMKRTCISSFMEYANVLGRAGRLDYLIRNFQPGYVEGGFTLNYTCPTNWK